MLERHGCFCGEGWVSSIRRTTSFITCYAFLAGSSRPDSRQQDSDESGSGRPDSSESATGSARDCQAVYDVEAQA